MVASETTVLPIRATIPNIETLVDRARGADPRAWEELYSRHFDFIFGTARKLGTPDAEVEDVVQEVFLVVFRKLRASEFDFQRGKLSTWMYRICANIVSDRHKKRRRRRVLARARHLFLREPQEVDAFDPAHVVEQSNKRHAISRILEAMHRKKREVLTLYEIEGLNGDEIAERLDINKATVRSRLFHARKDFLRIAKKQGVVHD